MNSNNSVAPTVGGPRDVFLHLLAIVTLYIAAISFGALIFAYIDRAFPDPLVYAGALSGSMRWAIASLIIVFPVYVGVSRFIEKEVRAIPEKRNLRTRRWLLYFTLFAAAVVIIGDLVALIYSFLGGDLTLRFILKVVTVLFIAASVFWYYLWNLRSDVMASRDPRMRFMVWGVVAIVAISVIGGFWVIGSPLTERLRRFDERRVQDLQTIQWQVVNYWQAKEELPDSLDQLRDAIGGFIPPVDPETGATYGYSKAGELSFELCAVFDTDAVDAKSMTQPVYGPGVPENWAHQAGETCFDRTIDPELYPPYQKTIR